MTLSFWECMGTEGVVKISMGASISWPSWPSWTGFQNIARPLEGLAHADGKAPAAVFPVQQDVTRALQNPWALAEATCKVTQRASWNAPIQLATYLAPKCTTVLARYALVGAFIGFSVCLPIGLSLAGEWARNRWHENLFAERIAALSQSVGGQPQRWNHLPEKMQALCAQELGDEGLFLDKMTISAASDIVTFAATAAVDIFQLLWLGNPTFLALSVGVGGLAYVAGQLQNGPPVRDSIALRQARNTLLVQGQHFWDNVVLGNQDNSQRWHHNMFVAAKRFFVTKSETLFTSCTSAHAAALPYMMSMYASQAQGFLPPDAQDPSPLMKAILPSIQSMISCMGNGLRLAQLRLRLVDIDSRNQTHAKNFMPLCSPALAEAPIETSKIKLFSAGKELSLEKYLENLKMFRAPGRYTVRGNNGRGKTNLLLRISGDCGADALMVPAKHNLNFPLDSGSTGQKVRQLFGYIDGLNPKPKVILLDEWAAHLDAERRAELDDMILRWSRHHSVVEVVH